MEELDLEEVIGNIDGRENKSINVYLVWSIDRISRDIELRAVCSSESRAKECARGVRKESEVRCKVHGDADLRPEIEKRDIDHFYGGDMIGDGKEWNKKIKNLED